MLTAIKNLSFMRITESGISHHPGDHYRFTAWIVGLCEALQEP
jgi:hypothetical protein